MSLEGNLGRLITLVSLCSGLAKRSHGQADRKLEESALVRVGVVSLCEVSSIQGAPSSSSHWHLAIPPLAP